MAAELNKTHGRSPGGPAGGLREYPDEIGGYHGCPSGRRSSSLKMEGVRVPAPARLKAFQDVAAPATVPWKIREA